MHRALRIAELVESVVDCLVGSRIPVLSSSHFPFSNLSADAERNVRSLRHTSTLFREPCLNAIWHTQITLIQLLRATGAVTELKETNRWTDKPEITFKSYKPLDSNDFSGVSLYSSRIKHLYLPCSDFSNHATIQYDLSSLLSPSQTMMLFPRLQGLTCTTLYASELPWILRTLGTSLLSFDLVAILDPSKLSDILDPSAAYLTSLTIPRLLIRLSDNPQGTYDGMCNILKKATSLHTLNLYTDFDVGQGIWQAISQSQSLDHLDIRALSAQFHAPVVNKAIFSSLVVLCIETSRLTALITAFKSSTFPYIQEIKCIINTSKQTNHLIKAVADACTANTLRKFHLKSVGDWRSVHEREGLNGAGSDVLRHLFRMRSMRELSLDVGWMWTLGDKFIQGLAQAWPNLTTLWLDPLGIWLQPHRITLGGLQALAVYCPHLIRLGIVLDASNLDFPSFPQPIGQRSMLYELSVGPSQIVSPGIVAGFLSETFPCLASIFLYEYDWDVTPLDPWYVEQWRYADRILKDMSMRRMVRGADVDTLAVAVQNTHL